MEEERKQPALLQNSLMIRILKLLRDQVRNEISSKLLAGREYKLYQDQDMNKASYQDQKG